MNLQFDPIILIYGLSAGILLLLSLRTWQMRPARGAAAWSLTMLFCAVFTVGVGLEILFVEPAYKLAMNRVIYLGTSGLTYFWGLFAIRYSGTGGWLAEKSKTLLAFVPLMVFCLALFAENHDLLYRDYRFVEIDGLLMGKVLSYGPVFWFWAVYAYGVMLLSWLLLLRAAIRSHSKFRVQTWLVILASGVPLLAYIMFLAGFAPFGPFDPTAMTLAFSGVVMLIAMSQYRFMDIMPVAYDLIFRNVKSGILLIDLKGRVAGMNSTAEHILGASESEMIGLPVRSAFPRYRHLIEQFWDVTDTRTEVALSDKGPFYELQISPLTNARQELAGRLVMFYDITERKQMESQALELAMEREQVRLLQQFISHMSHDLRTPLTAMKTSQYLLRRELAGQDTARLDVLDEQTERLSNMVESMLTLLRLEEAAPDTLLQVDINSLVRGMIAQHRVQAEPRGLVLCFQPAEQCQSVLANAEDIYLALSELLTNAMNYSHDDSEITIVTECDANSVSVSVQDKGTGIAENDLPHIFERFYRVDLARGTHNGGSGLGLSIARAVAERHGGSIEVRSRPGEGSEFCLRLPLATSAAALLTRAPSGNETDSAAQPTAAAGQPALMKSS